MTTTPEAMGDGIRPFIDAGQAADAVGTTAFSIPVKQAAELFKQAGFPRSTDHISRCGAGRASCAPPSRPRTTD